jgi:uncharacterized LabA/DUF88 family protein
VLLVQGPPGVIARRLLLFEGWVMRVSVYVDGFNLYYRALKNTPHRWLNLLALAQTQVGAGDTITTVRYFTARVSSRAGDPEAPRRQQIYFSALQTVPEIQFHYGRFMSKTKRRPLVSNPTTFVEIHDTEEKGSDVNLASHLLLDGCQDRYDMALVLSQDTDLIEPMRMVTQELKKTLGLVWLDGKRPSQYI